MCFTDKEFPVSLYDCAYDWQTLLAAMIALVAALLTTRYLKKQINQTARIQEEKDRRRLTAARTVFSLSLSQTCQFAVDTAKELARLSGAMREPISGMLDNVRADFPDIPESVVNAFERIVEAANHKNVIVRLSQTVQSLQVVSSRTSDLQRRISLGQDISLYLASRFADAAVLYAQASSLFEYARDNSNEVNPITWSEVETALLVLETEIGASIPGAKTRIKNARKASQRVEVSALS